MESAFHPLKIRDLTIVSNIIQAPLASYSSRSYRHLCALHSSPLATTEMVSVEGLLREGEKTLSLLSLSDTEKAQNLYENDERRIPLSIQLFGSNPSSFEKATKVLLKQYIPYVIDVNAACPVKKVTKTGSGASLMEDPKKLGEIVKILKETTEDRVAITVKIRLGKDENRMNYLQCAEECFKNGAALVAMHSRTENALYSGKADHTHTKLLKKTFPEFLIIASGDIYSREEAKVVIETTGVDGVLVARGAIGNPFIFEESESSRTDRDYINAFLKHLELETYYNDVPLKELRKFAPYYLKHLKHSENVKEARVKICTSATTKEDYKALLETIKVL